jgi:hypothetical protein
LPGFSCRPKTARQLTVVVTIVILTIGGGRGAGDDLQPHPDAKANTHTPGEVDRPELIPLIVRDPQLLDGIVVDETHAMLQGSWQYSTHTPPYVGLGYLHDQNSEKGQSSVTFTPTLPHNGLYEVRLAHCWNSRRATNTPVTVGYAGGETTIRVNQQQTPEHNQLFRSLGTFPFKAGTSGWVRVSNEGTDGKYVIADAVQFLPVSESAVQPGADAFDDAAPQMYQLTARASEIDRRVLPHPEINFLIDNPDGRPADLQHAAVDTRVQPRGQLVIWLMGYNEQLFDRLTSYGLHVIRPHYANKWFSLCCRDQPVGEHCRGNIRLEAATGMDFSADVDIPRPDGMMERSLQFVRWLDANHPEGNWGQFLTDAGDDLRWEQVIMSGSSHGSTTAARFAKHQRVARVVALCGPRDQYQSWQSLPSATPENRYFGFSHVLDGGWTGDHYCRSWELLGMHRFGPIVNVDQSQPPFGNTRRLITDFDVDGDTRRAHSAVQPGRSAWKDGKTGRYMHEEVWRYLYTHPVEQVGPATAPDPDCIKDQRP